MRFTHLNIWTIANVDRKTRDETKLAVMSFTVLFAIAYLTISFVS